MLECSTELRMGQMGSFQRRTKTPTNKKVASKYYSNFVVDRDVGAKRNNTFHEVMRVAN
jgi:hypothetical protein